jgi:hypothetical protein
VSGGVGLILFSPSVRWGLWGRFASSLPLFVTLGLGLATNFSLNSLLVVREVSLFDTSVRNAWLRFRYELLLSLFSPIKGDT